MQLSKLTFFIIEQSSESGQCIPILQAVLWIRTDLDRIRPLRTDRIRIHLSKMYLVVPKV